MARRGLGSALLLGALVLALVAAPSEAAGAKPESGSSDWRVVTAGQLHTCGLRTSGRLFCWGNDDPGQLGNGPVTGDQPTPTEVSGGHTDWIAVAAGRSHTCGIRSNHRLYCWGTNGSGQLGNGGGGNQPSPVLVS